MDNNYEVKYFKTSVIATIIENYICGDFTFEDLYDFANFILGKEIKRGTLYDYKIEIKNKIFEQYPELKEVVRINTDIPMDKNQIILKERYFDKYGDFMSIIGKNPKNKKGKILTKIYRKKYNN